MDGVGVGSGIQTVETGEGLLTVDGGSGPGAGEWGSPQNPETTPPLPATMDTGPTCVT